MLLLLLFSLFSYSEPLKVAIIDSGFDSRYIDQLPLCGTADFSGKGIHDTEGHGTNVAGIINKYNTNKAVCFMIIKYNPKDNKNVQYLLALAFAINNGAKVINFSGGGGGFMEEERQLIKNFLDNKGIFVAAAGNEWKDLNKDCDYFPACSDPRVFVVSNTQQYSNKLKSSTVMKFDGATEYIYGTNLHGTSQSAALFTAFLLNYLKDHKQWTQ